MQSDWSLYAPEQRRKLIEEKYYGLTYPAGKSHDAVKFVRNLRKNNKLEKHEQGFWVILEGLSLLEAAIRYQVNIEYLFICPDDIFSFEARSLLDQLIHASQLSLIVSKRTFELISAKDNSNGFMAICNIPKNSLAKIQAQTSDIVVILDGLETPGNIGSILRSADAINAGGIIITNRQARLYHPLMVRSSRGACLKIPIVESNVNDASRHLLQQGYQIVLADPSAAEFYYQQKYVQPTALVMGSERFGISQSWYNYPHTKVSIPMLGDCDSLNVSIATTVLLYEIRLQHQNVLNR